MKCVFLCSQLGYFYCCADTLSLLSKIFNNTASFNHMFLYAFMYLDVYVKAWNFCIMFHIIGSLHHMVNVTVSHLALLCI